MSSGIRPPAPVPPKGAASNVAKIIPMANTIPNQAFIPPVLIPNPFFNQPNEVLQMQQQSDSGPAAKRFRPEESLVSEEMWMQKVSGEIIVHVSTPPTQEWDLEGKNFQISLNISSQVIIFLRFFLSKLTGIISGYGFKIVGARKNWRSGFEAETCLRGKLLYF